MGSFPPFSPPAFDHLDPTARQLRHRLVQDRKVLLPAERVQQSGQGRLRRQPVALLQGRRAPTGLARHPQARILTQAVGVGLVAPALPQQQESSPQQIRQRIADRTRVSRIVQPLGQPIDEAAALHQLPLHQGSRVRTEPLGAGLEAEGSVE